MHSEPRNKTELNVQFHSPAALLLPKEPQSRSRRSGRGRDYHILIYSRTIMVLFVMSRLL
jgi:hypothetical protein